MYGLRSTIEGRDEFIIDDYRLLRDKSDVSRR